MSKRIITLTVNGDTHEVAVSPMQTLNQVIRDDLRLTGTKRGCTSGSCGVCTVNDERGRAILSCITLAVEWDGRAITTIEGVALRRQPGLCSEGLSKGHLDLYAATYLFAYKDKVCEGCNSMGMRLCAIILDAMYKKAQNS